MQQLIYALKRPYHFFKTALRQALPAQIKYLFPNRRLKIIAITGTDGKTTSSTMLYQVLQQAGYKVALISTVAAYINEQEIDTGFHVTSPDPASLTKLMAKMLKEKVEYLILEYTSQGAYQFRLFGIRPLISGVTNIAQDHFDYHLNFKNYLDAKALVLKQSKTVLINRDDNSYYRLRKKLSGSSVNIQEFSKDERLGSTLSRAVKERFPEQFNQMNARLVIKIAQNLGLDNKSIADGLSKFTGVPGRMQFVPNPKQLNVVVDFAHTPQGLENALVALRNYMDKKKLTGRLIAIFGCAGLRDASKRSLMGHLGAELADLAIFTAEDPRTENVWSIIRQMKEDLPGSHQKVISIADREEAINFALKKLTKRNDLVAILGKGPEKSMAYGHEERPWSDVEAVLAATKK